MYTTKLVITLVHFKQDLKEIEGQMMFLLRGAIGHYLYTNSPLTIIFYDFKQCFDDIWLQDSKSCLWNAGVQDELVFRYAKIKIFTPFGDTRMFEVDDIVKNGTTLGPILSGISTGEYCETEIFFIGDTKIGLLGFVDDLASINQTENDILRSHESTIHFQNKNRLQLSESKCNMLKINSKKQISQQ